jgi:hypothetical protein
MIRNLRRTNLMLIVGVLAILASAVIRPTPESCFGDQIQRADAGWTTVGLDI